jgi:MFS family permease
VSAGPTLRRFRVPPLQYPDFGWAWLTPFLSFETMPDRPGRRKPSIVGSPVMAIVVPARLTEVLPAAADRAKHLGLINIAYNLPLVVGPPIAGVVLGLMNSYPALFAVAGGVTLAAAATVTRVRLTA